MAVNSVNYIDQVDWEKVNQLVPAIVQDYVTAEVLMLGYMSKEALSKTIETQKVTFWSRTQNKLWTKGETSGNYLNFVEMSLDCDNDTLLILVNPVGNTCHLEQTSCFEASSKNVPWVFFSRLEQMLESRKNADPDSSYTAALYASGTKRMAQKVGEEGVEVALAATVNDREELICETADLLYHTTVLLHDQNLSWEDILIKLQERNS